MGNSYLISEFICAGEEHVVYSMLLYAAQIGKITASVIGLLPKSSSPEILPFQ